MWAFYYTYVNLQRPRTIKIKAQNEDGAKVSLTITDEYLARIFQHEYDHLEVCHLVYINAPVVLLPAWYCSTAHVSCAGYSLS